MLTSIKCYVNCNNTSVLKFCIAIQTYSNRVKVKIEELTSHVSVAQKSSKILQEAFKTTSSKLVELERQHHKLEQGIFRNWSSGT